MTDTLPLVGAAMRVENLADYSHWLIEGQRDLEIQDAAWFGTLDGDWRSLVKEAKSILNGYTGRMGIHGPFVGLPLLAPDPRIQEVVSDRLKQALEICAELGGSHMVIHSPFQFLGTPLNTDTDDMQSNMYGQFIHKTLAPVVEFATQYQITLVIENIFDYDPYLLLRLVKSFDSACVRMSLDTGHAFVSHVYNHAPTPDYWVKAAGEHLAHIHLQDTDGEADRHWILGEGNIKWHTLFRALRDLDHNPRLILELADKAGIPKAVAWLEENGLAR